MIGVDIQDVESRCLGDKSTLPTRAQALGKGRACPSSSTAEVVPGVPVSLAQLVPFSPKRLTGYQ